MNFERVKKIIEKFKKKFPKTLLSIDTRKSSVIDYSLKKNAEILLTIFLALNLMIIRLIQ